MLAKQLIQLSGMTADKAKAVVNVYPTPTRFVTKYSTNFCALLGNFNYFWDVTDT